MKPNPKYLLIFLILLSSLSADLKFSSSEVTTKGKEVELKGNVAIEHDFGTVYAQEATLTQSEGESGLPFLNAMLNSSVEIQFATNQTLKSETANIDFQKHEASMHSSKGKIIFSDPDTQITIQSQSLKCEWEQEGSKPKLKRLYADESVQISLGSDIYISADDIEYTSSSSHQGVLKFGSLRKEKPCLISIGDDLLKAKSATIELGNDTITLHRPIGKIATTFIENLNTDEIYFTSKNLILNRESGQISLSEQILVNGADFGQLTSNETVTFNTEKIDEKILFKGFCTKGESFLATDQGMKISCDGEIEFDYENKKLVAGANIKPILYQNGNIVIESNKMTLNKLKGAPELICFSDHVHFLAGSMVGNSGFLNYHPQEHLLEFFSSDKEKVVFYNQDSDTKMCADGITITYDPVTEENEIRGHGVVRITFDHTNQEQIIEVLNSCARHPF